MVDDDSSKWEQGLFLQRAQSLLLLLYCSSLLFLTSNTRPLRS